MIGQINTPERTYTLYLTYNEYHTGGGVCEGQEDDAYPDYEDENVEWYLLECRLTRSKTTWYHEELTVDFEPKVNDTVYVVYVRYGDGNTFGHTNGCWNILGVYSNELDAMRVKESVEDDSYEGYKCWEGYFNNLERCEIEGMIVRD